MGRRKKSEIEPMVWRQDQDGDWFYDGNCICPHEPPDFRVGYDWGLKLAIFPTLEAAKTFVEQWVAEEK